MSANVVTVDVREDLRRGREPFSRIMGAADQLQPGQALRIIAPLKPTPLMGVMANRGFKNTAKELGGGDWEVLFEPQVGTPVTPAPSAPPDCPARPAGEVLDVDARGLEPPQPMVKILEALSALPEGATLRARTDRRPMHLYPHIEQRGFRAASEEQHDGSFITTIRRA